MPITATPSAVDVIEGTAVEFSASGVPTQFSRFSIANGSNIEESWTGCVGPDGSIYASLGNTTGDSDVAKKDPSTGLWSIVRDVAGYHRGMVVGITSGGILVSTVSGYDIDAKLRIDDGTTVYRLLPSDWILC